MYAWSWDPVWCRRYVTICTLKRYHYLCKMAHVVCPSPTAFSPVTDTDQCEKSHEGLKMRGTREDTDSPTQLEDALCSDLRKQEQGGLRPEPTLGLAAKLPVPIHSFLKHSLGLVHAHCCAGHTESSLRELTGQWKRRTCMSTT